MIERVLIGQYKIRQRIHIDDTPQGSRDNLDVINHRCEPKKQHQKNFGEMANVAIKHRRSRDDKAQSQSEKDLQGEYGQEHGPGQRHRNSKKKQRHREKNDQRQDELG